MDRVVSTIGKKNNCTFCGVFRRQALDRGAATLGVDHIVTGHNADDIAETVLMNSTSVRGPPKTDSRSHIGGQSCEAILRGSVGAPRSVHREKTRYGGPSPSSMRMKRRSSCRFGAFPPPVHSAHATVHRYAYFKKLDYFSTECIYSPDAYRGHARAFLKDLEAARPSAIIDIIHSGEAFEVKDEIRATQKAQRAYRSLCSPLICANDLFVCIETCIRCGYMSSNDLCKACSLLEGLERGMSNAAIVRPSCLSPLLESLSCLHRPTKVAGN